MGIPVVARLLALLAKALKRVTVEAFKKAPEAAKQIGARLGWAASRATPTNIIAAMKNNKIVTAITLYTLYGIGDDILQEMMAEDAEVAAAVKLFGFVPDEPEVDHVARNQQMREEYALISDTAARFGGVDVLVQLKQALSLSTDTYIAYKSDRDLFKHLT